VTRSARDFYDQLADGYHLIFADWDRAVREQGEILDRLLRSETGAGRLSILDCSCGIGTQAIGLALQGHNLTATDLSPESVERARKEAERFGVKIAFGVADFRALEERIEGTFDAVISCDNALPHMLTREDLLLAARSIRSRLRPDGLFLASIRDYDSIVQVRPPSTLPSVSNHPEGKRIYFQAWDWHDDGRTYTVHLFLLTESRGHWEVRHHETRYRAVLRKEMENILREAGLADIAWHPPADSGYYQPIVTARRR
jgi:glycine/sarcosine N-methyltransferase